MCAVCAPSARHHATIQCSTYFQNAKQTLLHGRELNVLLSYFVVDKIDFFIICQHILAIKVDLCFSQSMYECS